MLRSVLRWLIIIVLFILGLGSFPGVISNGQWINAGWCIIMVTAALGLIFTWQWTRYAYYLLAAAPTLYYLRTFIAIWHSGGLQKYPERAQEDITFGILTIALCLATSAFVYTHFRRSRPLTPDASQEALPASDGSSSHMERPAMTAITFKDIIKGLLFILLMVIAYCVIVKLGKFIFYTVTGSNDLPFIVPLMICITIGYACIAALAKAVESGFSLRSIFRGDGRNPVIK